MLTVRCFRHGQVAEEGFDPERVSDLLDEEDTLIWLDVVDPSADDIALLEKEFSLHETVVEDMQHRGQRPKVEVYENLFFVVLHAVEVAGQDIASHEVHALVGRKFLVTLRYAPPFDLADVERRWALEPELAREGGGYLLHVLVDEVVDGYFDVIDKIEIASEDVENSILADRPPEDIQERIFVIKKQLIEFRRLVMPLREVLDLLQENPKVVTQTLQPYYRDVADHVIRSLEFIDNLRELLTTALDAHLSRVSTQLNVVMKKVTSWAAILLVPTLVAGIYGMNFRYMPELDWRFGYPFALGLMLVAGFLLFRAFKKRDWI